MPLIQLGTTARRPAQEGLQVGPIVLFKIESLHARTVQETGLTIRQRGTEIVTGTIVAHLDDSAAFPTNLALVDLATGAIQLRWAIIAALPFLADAFASGSLSPKDSSPVRATLDETGQVLDDGSGFQVKGTAQIKPGSLLSAADITLHNNLVQIATEGRKSTSVSALASGAGVRCTLVPESSYLDVTLPKSMGGQSQRLNLVGGFRLVPVMTLAPPQPTKRSRR
jgi:hypothetical protein